MNKQTKREKQSRNGFKLTLGVTFSRSHLEALGMTALQQSEMLANILQGKMDYINGPSYQLNLFDTNTIFISTQSPTPSTCGNPFIREALKMSVIENLAAHPSVLSSPHAT